MASPKRSGNRRKFNREPIDIEDLASASSFTGIRDVIESHFGKGDVPNPGEAPTGILPRGFEIDPSRRQYCWAPLGAPVNVRLDSELIDRLERDSVAIFRALTERGSEIGGILLGHVVPGNPPVVVVEDYEPAACAYDRGPGFVLTDQELEALEQSLERHQSEGPLAPVGFFRSNTRPKLSMEDDDLTLFEEAFPEPHAVFLLAKPFSRKPCQGAIFIRHAGHVNVEASDLEFPLSSAELESHGLLKPAIRLAAAEAAVAEPPKAPPVAPPAPVPTSVPEPVAEVDEDPTPVQAEPILSGREPEPVPESELEAAPDAAAPRSFGRLLWAVPVLVLLAVVGWFMVPHPRRSAPEPAAAAATRKDVPVELALRTEGSGDGLIIRWDPAPVVLAATHGRLTVQDGSATNVINLSADELKTGEYSYKPQTDDITIRLELPDLPKGGRALGVTRVLGARRIAPPPAAGKRR